MSEELERGLNRAIDDGDVSLSLAVDAEYALKGYRKALERSMLAIDDWLSTYASEHCDLDRVHEARARIDCVGTLAYIASVQQQNREALGK